MPITMQNVPKSLNLEQIILCVTHLILALALPPMYKTIRGHGYLITTKSHIAEMNLV